MVDGSCPDFLSSCPCAIYTQDHPINYHKEDLRTTKFGQQFALCRILLASSWLVACALMAPEVCLPQVACCRSGANSKPAEPSTLLLGNSHSYYNRFAYGKSESRDHRNQGSIKQFMPLISTASPLDLLPDSAHANRFRRECRVILSLWENMPSPCRLENWEYIISRYLL